MKKKIILQKEYTREQPLFYLYMWYYSNYVRSHKLIGDGVKTSLYIYEQSNNPICTSWYNPEDLKRIGKKILELVKNRKDFVDWIEKDFNKYWNKIIPYLEKKKKIKSIKELKEVYENSIAFFFPESVVILGSNIPNLKEKERRRLLELREIAQEKVNDMGDIYLEFIYESYPELKDIAHYLLPKEVFSLENSKLNKEQIKERKEKGCFLLNGKLYLFNELDNILNENNLQLGEPMENIFTREHSREYSLIRVDGWTKAMGKCLKEITGKGIDNACAVFRGGLCDMYYEKEDFEQAIAAGAKSSMDVKYMTNEIDKFLKLFKKLRLYYDRKKKIKNIKELRKFHESYSKSWAYIAIIFKIPIMPGVSEELKKKAYEARVKTQEYAETPEEIYKEFIERKFPLVKGNYRFVLIDEIYSSKANNPQILHNIEERKKGFVFYKGKLYVGEDVDETLKKLGIILADANVNKKETIKGQIGFKGKVKGQVKIVAGINELSKVNKGDILVATMTMPKYLPAMKRAAAFVTDEGGITCHAAIVSRELGKPCIIGTRVATKILKDGDLIEVDANKGIVRILERK